ncbi:uncharacterized protein LOC131692407 [Topomyia yanbarensis]|uniref:uncharacterized protein LOC131692407 n=1 Tax=Topomyia yanbarensis TaxID=2498891 RepID=UPI00273BBF35|nr:uncharacterized protein LOC131692407 [Topomyia yanbarensis]
MIRPGHRHEPWNQCKDDKFGDSPVYNWVEWSVTAGVQPAHAVQAGTDSDGSPIFVGRVNHYGSVLPAKVIPIRRVAYTSSEGIEIFKANIEVLCGLGFTWIPSERGYVPKGAVSCGNSAFGEPVYIGRAHHDGSVTPGKIVPKHGCLYIPYAGYEHAHPQYEVLVDARKSQKQSVGGKWVPAETKGSIPPGALIAGNDSDGTQIYLGRVYRHGLVLPAKVIPRKQMCHTGDEGLEFDMTEYETLCHANVSWVPFRGVYPINAIECGLDRNGEKLYFGRGRYKGSLTPGKILECSKVLKIPFDWKEIPLREFDILVDNSHPTNKCSQTLYWQSSTNKSSVPKGALLAGYESNRSPIYLGRVMFEGNQLPAKVIPRKNICHTGHRGKEHVMSSYEALCNARVSWLPFRGIIPPKAIICGRTQWGEAVYVGRGPYKGSLTPGKILENEKVLRIPFDWNEVAIRDAEILVEI